MKSLFYNFTFILLIYTKHLCSDELINEFNFSAAIDGIYILEDGRKFEALSHEGHIKNNIGNYGIIKCNSLTETKKENLIFLKVMALLLVPLQFLSYGIIPIVDISLLIWWFEFCFSCTRNFSFTKFIISFLI